MLKVLFLFLAFSANAEEIKQANSEILRTSVFENGLDLYGGTKSVAGEFLAMGFLGHCTATVNGPQTIITAGHCNSSGSRVKFALRGAPSSYALTCTRHPRYNDRTVFNDFTFCKLDSGSFPVGTPMMSMGKSSPETGEKLLLNGYGAPNIGNHFWGDEALDRISGQDLVACGSTYLGGGDSGGTVLRWTEDRSGKSGFEGLAINSRAGGGCSYLNRFSHEEFISFAQDYERSAGVKMCGYSAVCTGSQPSPSPSPSQPPVPTNCQQIYEEFAFCIGTKAKPECIGRAEKLVLCVK